MSDAGKPCATAARILVTRNWLRCRRIPAAAAPADRSAAADDHDFSSSPDGNVGAGLAQRRALS